MSRPLIVEIGKLAVGRDVAPEVTWKSGALAPRQASNKNRASAPIAKNTIPVYPQALVTSVTDSFVLKE
jgi:hypothetical protein